MAFNHQIILYHDSNTKIIYCTNVILTIKLIINVKNNPSSPISLFF